jgi:arsenate reductase
MKNVLFLCTGNSARSQIAEAYLRHYAGDRFQVYSCGLEPAGINPFTIRVMDEVGIDIREQRSKSVKEFMGKMPFHYVITVCKHADANCPEALWSHGEKLYWPFDDPAGADGNDFQKMRAFRQARDAIHAQIKSWLEL